MIKHYRMILKTPVHIGSGDKLGRLDFLPQQDKCYIIDIDSLLERFKDNPAALSEFGQREFKLGDFLWDYKIKPEKVAKYTLDNPHRLRMREISEMIKTGLCKPLIPGTSIKGALRTVILWHLFQKTDKSEVSDVLNRILNDRDIKKEQADAELDHYLFGPDPNHDFLRGLQVGDATFKLPDLKLIETKVLSIDGRGSHGWKKMGRDGFNTSRVEEATPIHCEAIYPKTEAEFRIKVEDFLFDEAITKAELDFSSRKNSLIDLPKICNEFAQEFISEEIGFFKSCQMNQIAQFYSNLLKEVPKDKDEKSFLLHLGWGSGWRGMTGDWMDDITLRRFRGKFRMGKSIRNRQTDRWEQFAIFPKTRKVIFENGQPTYPLGWVKVEEKEE